MATKKTVTKKSVAAEVKELRARLKKSAPSGGHAKKKENLTSWGFTRYNDYKQCPRKAKLKYIDKIEEPPNEAMQRGTDIDRLATLYVQGALPARVPPELSRFRGEFEELRAAYKHYRARVIVQDTWAFRADWSKTTWNDWAGCKLRVKIDAGLFVKLTVLQITDWKTGKYRADRREEYTEQLELYALAAFAQFPALEKVTARLCYLDLGVTFPEPGSPEAARLSFTRADVPRLKKLWDVRTRALLLDRSFAARPNEKCRYCHYRKENTPNLPGKKKLCDY